MEQTPRISIPLWAEGEIDVTGWDQPEGIAYLADGLRGAGSWVGYLGKWHLASTRVQCGSDVNFESAPVPPEYRGGYADCWLASDVLEFTSHAYDGHMFDAQMHRRDFPPGRYRADVVHCSSYG